MSKGAPGWGLNPLLRFGVEPVPVKETERVGALRSMLGKEMPIHGYRVTAWKDLCGWYLWRGEGDPDDEGEFGTLHVHHVVERDPFLAPYLLLPVGWRFVVAPTYEDVWFDNDLLERHRQNPDLA